jgi:outer membrane biogenesis lipoprotein LolB
LIREFIDYRDDNGFTSEFAWKRVAKKHNLDHDTYEQWNQWTLDVLEYSTHNNPKYSLQ